MNQPMPNSRSTTCQTSVTAPVRPTRTPAARMPTVTMVVGRSRDATRADDARGQDHRHALDELDGAQPDGVDLEDLDDERQEQDVDRAQTEHRDGQGEQRRPQHARAGHDAQALDDRAPGALLADALGAGVDAPDGRGHAMTMTAEARNVPASTRKAGQVTPTTPTMKPAMAVPMTPATTRVAWVMELAASSPSDGTTWGMSAPRAGVKNVPIDDWMKASTTSSGRGRRWPRARSPGPRWPAGRRRRS